MCGLQAFSRGIEWGQRGAAQCCVLGLDRRMVVRLIALDLLKVHEITSPSEQSPLHEWSGCRPSTKASFLPWIILSKDSLLFLSPPPFPTAPVLLSSIITRALVHLAFHHHMILDSLLLPLPVSCHSLCKPCLTRQIPVACWCIQHCFKAPSNTPVHPALF